MSITEKLVEKMTLIEPGPNECFELGLICWEHFAELDEGKLLFELLTTRELQQRAMKNFQMGFGIRWELCPPTGIAVLDKLFTPPLCSKLWDDYVETCRGEIVIDGEAYPNTPELILNMAEILFIHGFVAATVAYSRLK